MSLGKSLASLSLSLILTCKAHSPHQATSRAGANTHLQADEGRHPACGSPPGAPQAPAPPQPMLQMGESKATERGGDAGEERSPACRPPQRPWPGPGKHARPSGALPPSVNGKGKDKDRAISYLGTAATVSSTGQTNKAPFSPLNINSQKQCAPLGTHGGDLPPLMHADSGGGVSAIDTTLKCESPWTQGQASSFLTVRGQDLGSAGARLGAEKVVGSWDDHSPRATYFPEPGSAMPLGGPQLQGSAGHSPAAGLALDPLTPGDSRESQ